MAHPYLIAADLISRVGGAKEYVALTDDDRDGATDAGVETWVQALTDSLADGYAARGGYTVPLDTADAALLKPFLLDIANYKLRSRGNRVAPKGDKELHDAAMKVLMQVAEGDFVLPSGGSGDTGTFANLDFDGYEQDLNRETLKNL